MIPEILQQWRELGLGGAGGAILGWVAKLLNDRYVQDWRLSEGELLERLEKGKITHRGKDRLRGEGVRAIRDNAGSFPPPDGNVEGWALPPELPCFWIRTGSSACPRSVQDGLPLLYVQLTGHDVSAAFDRRMEIVGAHDSIAWKLMRLGSPDHVVVWVDCDQYMVSTLGEASALRDTIKETVWRWLPGAKLIVEIPMSSDVAESLSSAGIRVRASAESDPSRSYPPTEAGIYASERSLFSAKMRSGIVLSEPQDTRREALPTELLNRRIPSELRERIGEPNGWSAVTLVGPPGAGKTDLAVHLARSLSERHWLVIFFPRGRLSDEILAAAALDREQGLAQIADAVSEGMPVDWHCTAQSRRAFRDALVEILRTNRCPVTFVFDDLSDGGTHALAAAAMLERFRTSGLRYLLAGRRLPSGVEDALLKVSDSEILRVRCDLWSTSEAEQIVSAWMGHRGSGTVQHWFREGILAREQRFSLYLLEALSSGSVDLAARPDGIVRTAIERHVHAVWEALPPAIRNYQTVGRADIARARTLAEHGAPHNDILLALGQDTTRDIGWLEMLLGRLCWTSRFNEHGSRVTTALISTCSDGSLSEIEAEHILSAGADVSVFRTWGNTSGEWRDNFIADGTAALYFGAAATGRNMSRFTPRTLAEMVRRLDELQSIDILTLSLPIDTLLTISDALRTADSELGSIIGRMLTPAFLSRLHEQSMQDGGEWVDGLASEVWSRAVHAGEDQLGPLSAIIAKLLPLSPRLHVLWTEALSSPTPDGFVALATLAARTDNPQAFFAEARARHVTHRRMIQVAVNVIPAKLGTFVLEELLTRSNEFAAREVGKIADAWWRRQHPEQILENLACLIPSVAGRDLNPFLAALAVRRGLKRLWLARPKNTASVLRALVSDGTGILERHAPVFQELVCGFAAASGMQRLTDQVCWIILSDGGTAVPDRNQGPLPVGEILRKAYQRPAWTLACADELRKVSIPTPGTRELVADGFPSDFSGSQRLPAAQYKWWDGGQRLGFLAHDEVSQARLYWRPRLSLKPADLQPD